ncbi:MAG TPA: hypothetical protein ENO07_05790 [candidate division Zixibacteria bacterium]|nr:hypothetical protein [candidate division Zixibacteria bacterium]
MIYRAGSRGYGKSELPKNQHGLLFMEFVTTGRIYYVDRKLLENPVFEGNSAKSETSEVLQPQRLKFGSGGPLFDKVAEICPVIEIELQAK